MELWLRDESLEDAENLPAPRSSPPRSFDDLEAAVAQLSEIAADLNTVD